MQIAMIGFTVLAYAACFFYTLELMNRDQKLDVCCCGGNALAGIF